MHFPESIKLCLACLWYNWHLFPTNNAHNISFFHIIHDHFTSAWPAIYKYTFPKACSHVNGRWLQSHLSSKPAPEFLTNEHMTKLDINSFICLVVSIEPAIGGVHVATAWFRRIVSFICDGDRGATRFPAVFSSYTNGWRLYSHLP